MLKTPMQLQPLHFAPNGANNMKRLKMALFG